MDKQKITITLEEEKVKKKNKIDFQPSKES